MHTALQARVLSLAAADSLHEICGFFYSDLAGKAHVFECHNVAADTTKEFEISSTDQIAAMNAGTLLGIYHSHPVGGENGFSPADLACADVMNLPFYLTSADWHEYIPKTYRPPLLAAPFVLGFSDCYGLVRNYFRQLHSVYLSDYQRDETFCHEEQGVIMASFEKEGFKLGSLDTLSIHDVLMFKSKKALPQHFGVYLEQNLFLHHPQSALSREEPLNDRWLDRLVCVFRCEKPLKSA